jgi:hypothetical protein
MDSKLELVHDLIYLLFNNEREVNELTGWDEPPVGVTRFSQLLFPRFSIDPDKLRARPFMQSCSIEAIEAIHSNLSTMSIETLTAKLSSLKNDKNALPVDLHYNDYSFWARNSHWNPADAVLLSLGLKPNSTPNFVLIEERFNFGYSCPLLVEFSDRLDLCTSAFHKKILPIESTPLQYIEWFEKLELAMPDGLAAYVRKFQSPSPVPTVNERNSELSNLERKTLLKIIAAMSAEQYGFDPRQQQNEAVTRITNDVVEIGQTIDIKTTRKWLKEAGKLINEDYWDS